MGWLAALVARGWARKALGCLLATFTIALFPLNLALLKSRRSNRRDLR